MNVQNPETQPPQADWLALIPQPTLRTLLTQAALVSVNRGGSVFLPGDPTGGIYRIISGVVAITDPEGQRDSFIGHLMGANAWFGEGSALTGSPRRVGIRALTDVQLAYAPRSLLEELGASCPSLWRGLAVLSATNTALAVQVARDIMKPRPEERCTAILRRLSASVGPGTPMPLSQEQFAEMCVLSRGAVSRILSRLEAAGKVQRGYRELTWLGD